MPALHQRGVDLLLDVLDAQNHFDKATPEELRAILKETAIVLAQLLERDIPASRRGPDDG